MAGATEVESGLGAVIFRPSPWRSLLSLFLFGIRAMVGGSVASVPLRVGEEPAPTVLRTEPEVRVSVRLQGTGAYFHPTHRITHRDAFRLSVLRLPSPPYAFQSTGRSSGWFLLSHGFTGVVLEVATGLVLEWPW